MIRFLEKLACIVLLVGSVSGAAALSAFLLSLFLSPLTLALVMYLLGALSIGIAWIKKDKLEGLLK